MLLQIVLSELGPELIDRGPLLLHVLLLPVLVEPEGRGRALVDGLFSEPVAGISTEPNLESELLRLLAEGAAEDMLMMVL